MAKSSLVVVSALILIVFISACVQQKPITEINIPGHPSYTFSNDVRDALRIRADNPDGIRNIISSADNLTIVFNGSSAEDNAYFTVAAFNIVTKVQTFFVYSGRVMEFPVYYFIGDQWIDSKGNNIDMPRLDNPTIWLKGPNTGATETSVSLDGKTILVQGTDYINLTLAGDRLVLVVLGVEKI